jgi:hypothetical protein
VVNNSFTTVQGGELMAKCPTCGKEVEPKKSWKMAGKPDKAGKRIELTIGLCECYGKPSGRHLANRKSNFKKNHNLHFIFLWI